MGNLIGREFNLVGNLIGREFNLVGNLIGRFKGSTAKLNSANILS